MIFRYPALYTFFVDLRKKEQKLIKKATLYSKQAVTSDIKGLTEFTKMKLKNDLSTKSILINDLLSPAKNAYIIVLELIGLADANNLLSIHKVRIAYKRFRYIMEILSDIYNLTPDELKKLKEFQDIMGFLQDNNVITTKLNSFILKQDIIPYADYEKALTSFARSRKTLLNKFFKISKEFEKNWGYILTH